jgi:nucleotide-binding universal stress UspA family protein
MTKILLPTDGSENAHKAGEHPIKTADLGADIIILYVIDTDYLNALSQQDLREKLEKKLGEEGERVVNNFKQQIEDAQCQGYCKNVNLIAQIKEGKPADIILKTIDEEGVDQVIMGKSDKSGIEKFFNESITKRIVKNSNVPVKIIS